MRSKEAMLRTRGSQASPLSAGFIRRSSLGKTSVCQAVKVAQKGKKELGWFAAGRWLQRSMK